MAQRPPTRRAIAPGLFELHDDGSLTLIGGYSPSSGHHHFPRFPLCPYSGADDVEPARLPDRGTLSLWTAVTAAPPGYSGPVPFGFGIVELHDDSQTDSQTGLRVVTRITEADPAALGFGMAMRLVADVVAVDEDGTEVVAWAFAPEPSSA
jgi:uncharacterized protein